MSDWLHTCARGVSCASNVWEAPARTSAGQMLAGGLRYLRLGITAHSSYGLFVWMFQMSSAKCDWNFTVFLPFRRTDLGGATGAFSGDKE